MNYLKSINLKYPFTSEQQNFRPIIIYNTAAV